jgi:hypothetical protein
VTAARGGGGERRRRGERKGAPQAGGDGEGRRWREAVRRAKKKKKSGQVSAEIRRLCIVFLRVLVKMLTQPVRYDANQPCSAGGSILDMPISFFCILAFRSIDAPRSL